SWQGRSAVRMTRTGNVLTFTSSSQRSTNTAQFVLNAYADNVTDLTVSLRRQQLPDLHFAPSDMHQ
ncbi:MAG: hypothetical protein M3H12_04395, partial [Chromatiales bacterium]